jgi:hypothetical protein
MYQYVMNACMCTIYPQHIHANKQYVCLYMQIRIYVCTNSTYNTRIDTYKSTDMYVYMYV